jgi:hypothetical protein
MEALGIHKSWSAEVTAVYHPNKANHAMYKDKFAQFERIYRLLSPEMGRL